ncbi:MAG: hypothetical protein WCA76_06235, partial [Candidatus Sulfotelmatobacter sp.]
ALSRPCRAVDSDDQFAFRVIVVGVVVHFASRRLYTSMFPIFRLPFRLEWWRQNALEIAAISFR